jgi:hypothetical protein
VSTLPTTKLKYKKEVVYYEMSGLINVTITDAEQEWKRRSGIKTFKGEDRCES